MGFKGITAARIKIPALMLVSAASVAFVFLLLPPLAQNPAYHSFADQRRMLGVPNFWNTVSNLPFLLVGIAGLRMCLTRPPGGRLAELRHVYATFFGGVALLAFGSSHYHLNPSTQTLFWDRLPMTVVFMALFSVVVGDCISPRWGRRLLVPLVALGVASVIYWAATERLAVGDLRPYALVQFLPILLIPLILLMYGTARMDSGYLWAILGTYVAAKIAEQFDDALFDATGILSGHSIKHLLAGLATFWMIPALKKRKPATRT